MKREFSIGKLFVIVIAAAVFCFSAYRLVTTLLEYRQGTAEYEDLEALVFSAVPSQAILLETAPSILEQIPTDDRKQETVQSQTEAETTAGAAAQEAKLSYVDFATLKTLNPDAVAWITLYGTNINYPVVQGEDNDFYLHHTFNGKENAAGAIFIDASIDKGMEADNVIVYGHNMKNGSMFGTLSYYKSESMVKNYPAFLVHTESGTYQYAVFAAYMTTALSDTYVYGFGTEESFQDYIRRMKEQSLYDTGVEVEPGDKIITLSTCSGSTKDSRFVVQAKRIEPALE